MGRFRFVLIIQFLILLLAVQIGLGAAAATALPSIPPQSILNKVISETGGPTFTPLYVPDLFKTQLTAFNGVLDNVENILDYGQAVSYFDQLGNLTEVVIPLKNNGTATLAPNFMTPGSNPMPAQIVGVLWQRGRGLMVMVAVFGGSYPAQFRFYYNSNQYYDEGMWYSPFIDYFGDGKLEAVDQGGLIAKVNGCVSVGLKQLCWWPYSDVQLRDQTVQALMVGAINRAYGRYQIQIGFNSWASMPDLIGSSKRTGCANQLKTAKIFNGLSACTANLVMTHSTSKMNGQPIGIWIVTANADLKAYRSNGAYTGLVPVGEYLVMDATPNLSTPGQVGVLFLVNINSNDHYLIPSVMMQSFAQSSQIDEWQVAIKDGTMSSRGF